MRGGVEVARYYYDPFGRRLWKEVGGTRRYFLYNHTGMVGEYDTSGNLIQEYHYTPGKPWGTDPVFTRVNGKLYYYMTDHRFAPRKLVDKAGTVVWAADYKAFGEAVFQVSIINNPLRLPGQYNDQETGLHYNYYRDYDPSIGRYIQADPVGLDGGLNFYAYALGNPVMFIDPLGLWVPGRDPLPQAVVDFSAGLGDGLLSGISLGLISGEYLRNITGANGVVNKCSSAYKNSNLAGVGIESLVGPMARLSYIRGAKSIPNIAVSAQHAVSLRNSLKWAHRKPFSKILGSWHMSSYLSLVSRGKSASEIIASAAKTNSKWTYGIVGGGVILSGSRVASESNK